MFQNTKRKLTLTNVSISKNVVDAIVSTTHDIDCRGRGPNPTCIKNLLRCLAKPTSTVESLFLHRHLGSEEIAALVLYSPHYSLKNMKFGYHLDDNDILGEIKWKRKVLDALWLNRSLTEDIIWFDEERVGDSDRAFL